MGINSTTLTNENTEPGSAAGRHAAQVAPPTNVFAWVKLFLVLLAIAVGFFGAIDRIPMLDSTASAAFFVFLYSLLVIGFIAAAYCQPFWLRLLLGVAFAASVQFYEGFRLATSTWPNYDSFVIMLQSMGFADNAWDHHRVPILLAIGHALLVLIAVVMRPSTPRRIARYLGLAPLAAIGILSSILYARGGDGANGLPPSFPSIAFSTIHIADKILSPAMERQEVKLKAVNRPIAQDLIYIVDESVLATYLDINHPDGVYSGLDRNPQTATISNFGIAASIALCSASVNYTLRHGGLRDDYANMNATLPSIFAYAQSAGMHTVYLDGQGIEGKYSNLMYQAEFEQIDYHVSLHEHPVLLRDQMLAREIINLSQDDQSSFIFVNKVGAHFPVQDKYPDSHLTYQPVSSRGNYVNISDTGSRVGFSGDPESWRLYRNAYRNTLTWNTGHFFDQIFEEADLQNSAIIYTADHGQRLHEDGSPGQNTHCSPAPRDEEGAVPLVFITPSDFATNLPEAAQFNHNKTSHYRLFSTVLQWMGYDKNQVTRIYGEDVTSRVADPYTYNAYFNARMGRKPVWLKIDPQRVATPITSDVSDGQQPLTEQPVDTPSDEQVPDTSS